MSKEKTKKIDTRCKNEGAFFIKKNHKNAFGQDPPCTQTVTRPSEKTAGNDKKKPFDKKHWRIQRYSKKYKLQRWEETCKMKVLRSYRASVKKNVDEGNLCGKNFGNTEKVGGDVGRRVYRKPHQEFSRIREESRKNAEEIVKVKGEMVSVRNARKQEKLEKFKKLSKKTRKGQPLMKERLELLLDQIKKSVGE